MSRLKCRAVTLALGAVAVLVMGTTAYGCGGSGGGSGGGFVTSPPGSFDTATFDNATFQ